MAFLSLTTEIPNCSIVDNDEVCGQLPINISQVEFGDLIPSRISRTKDQYQKLFDMSDYKNIKFGSKPLG